MRCVSLFLLLLIFLPFFFIFYLYLFLSVKYKINYVIVKLSSQIIYLSPFPVLHCNVIFYKIFFSMLLYIIQFSLLFFFLFKGSQLQNAMFSYVFLLTSEPLSDVHVRNHLPTSTERKCESHHVQNNIGGINSRTLWLTAVVFALNKYD